MKNFNIIGAIACLANIVFALCSKNFHAAIGWFSAFCFCMSIIAGKTK